MAGTTHLSGSDFGQIIDRLPQALTISSAIRGDDGRALDMRLEYMNATARAGSSSPDAEIGTRVSDLWPQLVENGALAACLRVLDTGTPETGEFWRPEARTGRPAGYEWRASRVGTDTLVWVWHDASATLAARWRLAESESRFRAAFDGAPVPMCLLAPDGRFSLVNASMARRFSQPAPTFKRRAFDELLAAGQPSFAEVVDRLVVDGVPAVETERRLDAGHGQTMQALISVSAVRDHNDRLLHLVAHVQDVGEKRLQLLAHAAAHDALTNLPNRTLFLDRLGHALARQERTASASAVLLVDIDQFKVINDSRGHAAGDQVLQTVATRLRETVRPGDTVARLGGDEFVVLCENLDPDGWKIGVAEIWRRIRGSLDAAVDFDGQSSVISVAAGVTGGPEPYASPALMLRDAATALHAAKRRGRGGCVVFDEQLGRRAHDRFDVETGLRRALERDEIEVHLQPLVDVESERLVGAEALVRWRCGGELRPPGVFLDVAEETGLIIDLSERVMRLAAEAFADWRERLDTAADLRLAVNVAAQQVAARGFVDQVGATLAAAGLPAHTLVVELTESSMMNDEIVRSGALQRLRDLGVRVALDDFGTGFSAIGYLRRLPVDILKVDRAFVESDGTVEHDPQALLRCFVDLARALRLQVVIEGIERPEQLEAARLAGFDIAQGYLLGRPVSLTQFEADHLR